MPETASPQPIRYERVGCAALLTIDRPRAANSIDLPTAAAFSAAIDRIRLDAGIRGVIITGAGGRIFCSGGDLKAYSEFETSADLETMVSRLGGLLDSLEELPIPVIAAIDGQAIGGGGELALACDLRFASTAATIAFPQVRLGIVPGWNGLERLTQLCGSSTAMRLLMSATEVGAEEALRCGLVDEVSLGSAVTSALKFVASLEAAAPLALAAVKRLVRKSATESRQTARREINERLSELWFSADHREAELAFREKRPPKFVGR
jgi:enoyl-CoA hydratase/carnithine racemase